MPTYEYQCTVCGHRFEKFQSFSADPIKECPVCGEPVKKVISAAGIIFKGSGWYINDSKNTTASSPAASKEKKADGEGTSTEKTSSEKSEAAKPAESPAGSSETKSESKPAGSSKVDAA